MYLTWSVEEDSKVIFLVVETQGVKGYIPIERYTFAALPKEWQKYLL